MTGSDLNALLKEWGISRRVFVDQLAATGYVITQDSVVKRWKIVPVAAERLMEKWRGDVSSRPAKMVRRKG